MKKRFVSMEMEQPSRWGFILLILGGLATIVVACNWLLITFGTVPFFLAFLAGTAGLSIMGSLATDGLERYWQKRRDEIMVARVEEMKAVSMNRDHIICGTGEIGHIPRG